MHSQQIAAVIIRLLWIGFIKSALTEVQSGYQWTELCVDFCSSNRHVLEPELGANYRHVTMCT